MDGTVKPIYIKTRAQVSETRAVDLGRPNFNGETADE